jgi:hypothetical protein
MHPDRIHAPRWAGWTAALLGLEYAISKAIMATREELGVVGFPAPPEAYEGFTRDVATAQIAGVPTGLATAALALALVHPWGRRLPRRALAAGAVLATVGWLAGASVVVASLTGLREDHDQWGVAALPLALAPPAVWLVLARSAVRDVGWRLPGAWVVAAAGCIAYGAMKLSWALGGELLMRESPVSSQALADMLAREPGWVASHWASVALAAVGVGVAAATARGDRLPRALAVWLPAAIGILMVVRAGYGAAGDVVTLAGGTDDARHIARWDLALWSPLFGAWGAAWLRASGAVSSIRLRSRLGSLPSWRSNQEAV